MRTALLVLLVGCGRVGFDALDDGGNTHPAGDGKSPAGDVGMSGPATFVSSTGANVAATNPSATLPQPQEAGDLLVVAVGWSSTASSIVMQDLAGDTFSSAFSPTSSNQLHLAMFFVSSAVASSNNTITALITPLATEASIAVALYRGAGAFGGSSEAGFSGTSMAFDGQIQTLTPNALVTAGFAGGKAPTTTSSGYTQRVSVSGNAVKTTLIEDATFAQPTTSTASLTLAGATDWGMGGFSFEP